MPTNHSPLHFIHLTHHIITRSTPNAQKNKNNPKQPPQPPPKRPKTNQKKTKPPLVSCVNKVRALNGVVDEHNAIKREIGVVRELVEKITTVKSSGDNVDGRNHQEEGEEEFGGASAEINDDLRIRTIVQPELERVEEMDEQQMVKQKNVSLT
ncbi:hypothetical protein PILCRDRAFT_15858 [Piloderma croceum F 1598]|uniref:Uncharacterized protein n=1 Tax=Piloderma croceum (strain F 1598) TaxID=765440 RepID=A0A0C3B601_PILCF|nr:hypothetical protein PILCRDRAFT_15858 [Piloderma croceum F 1598]